MPVTPQTIENNVMVMLSTMQGINGETIRKFTRAMVGLTPPDGVVDLDEFVESAARRIEAKLLLTMPDAAVVKLMFEPWLESRRSSVDLFYSDRYLEYLKGGGFPPKVLATIDKDGDKITGLLQDPGCDGKWSRRGLVVGHVQSGKTANYTGVICKAADYGYKFIVLFAGIHNNLRRQTQGRIEEGFIGIDTDLTMAGKGRGGTQAWTGVGRIRPGKQPVYGTTKSSDFRVSIANSMGISFQSVREPIILVIKKQKTVLQNLLAWLEANNPSSRGVIANVPMLVLDDEADNASINTRGDEDPTVINGLIRDLLSRFEKSCYVGYTATPFANIFINPDSTDEMLGEDLFPRDFIVSLDAPDNYVGASRVFGEDGDLGVAMLREVEDHMEVLPEKHKISLKLESLPDSLIAAIDTFILARAIRILRGGTADHNSMLVNVSRFNAVQRQVADLIQIYLGDLRNAVRANAGLKQERALQDPLIRGLHSIWVQEFAVAHPDWDSIQKILNESISAITVRTINNVSADSLDYKAYASDGLNVIAVGGLSLSRGFTLEGLTVSYFLRNSIMYDTLLQMGRWFGFRTGYEDLCRLYMTGEAISWYRHISTALDELRDEFRLMERMGRKPQDFGLKVRAHPDSLIVTARNKMRTGKNIVHSVEVQGRLIETTVLRTDAFETNFLAATRLIDALDQTAGIQKPGSDEEELLWRRVPASLVCAFLSGFHNHDSSMSTQVDPLVRYIQQHEGGSLDSWDVCIYSPKSGKDSSDPVKLGQRVIQPAIRNGIYHPMDARFLVSGKSSRVASRGDEKVGLSEKELSRAEEAFALEHGDTKNVSDWYYRRERSTPLLMLRLIDPHEKKDGLKLRIKAKGQAVAWGISFPPEGETRDSTIAPRGKTALVQFVVNTVWARENAELDEDGEEALEDVDVNS